MLLLTEIIMFRKMLLVTDLAHVIGSVCILALEFFLLSNGTFFKICHTPLTYVEYFFLFKMSSNSFVAV